MTGEVLPFGEGRKPSPFAARIRAAKANIPDHDPHQDFLDVLEMAVERFDASGRPSPPAASPLDADQVKTLTYATERAAERGVGIYAKRIASWHQAIVGGVFVAGLSIGLVGGWGWRGAPPDLTCTDQPNGSRVCYMFTRMAPQQPAVPPPATSRGGRQQ